MTDTLQREGAARFWAKVDRGEPDECWVWRAGTTNGYGSFHVNNPRRSVLAHRWAYEHAIGPIPEGLQLDHLCRVPACVNPDHLEPVTSRENTMRGRNQTAANAHKTHCPQGHPYSGDNLVWWGRKRYCRTCTQIRARVRWAGRADA